MSSNMRQKKFVLCKQAIELSISHSFEWSLQELRHHIMVAIAMPLLRWIGWILSYGALCTTLARTHADLQSIMHAQPASRFVRLR